MSKKSRRRNKKILGALGAALAGGAMMLGRKKGTAFPRPKAGTIDQMAADNMPKNIDKVIEDVAVPKNIINPNLGRMTGAGPEGGLTGQSKRANYAKRMRNIDMDTRRNNMLRAIRGTMPAPRVLDPMEQFVMDNPLDVSAKDGGRIVKGEKKAVRVKKKKGIQIRGFGKARR